MPGSSNRSIGPGRREPVRGDTSLRTSEDAVEQAERNRGSYSALAPVHLPCKSPQPRFTAAQIPLSSVYQSQEQSTGNATHSQSYRDPASQQHVPAYFPPSPPSTISGEEDAPTNTDPGSPGVTTTAAQTETREDAENSHNAGIRACQRCCLGKAPRQNRPALSYTGTSADTTHLPNLRECAHFEAEAMDIQSAEPAKGRVGIAVQQLPETPRQTPASSVNVSFPCISPLQHHPRQSAEAFFRSILPAFPRDAAHELVGYAVDASIDLICPAWSGAVLDRTHIDGTRTLYTILPSHATTADTLGLRSDILALLDTASEDLMCSRCVIGLRRDEMDQRDAKATLHGLCYVGGNVISSTVPGHLARDPISNCTIAANVIIVIVEL